jgi:hypothetical protein
MPCNTDFVMDSSKERELKIYAEKTKYIFMSRHQNAGQNHNIVIANRFFENVAQLKYSVSTETSKWYF